MIKYNDVESGLNSARLIMIQYLTQQVKLSCDGKITFNEKAYSLVSSTSDGNIEFAKPQRLILSDGNKHCQLVLSCDGNETIVSINDLSADDLYSLSEMVHDISRDVFTEDAYSDVELVDLAEDEFEVLAF